MHIDIPAHLGIEAPEHMPIKVLHDKLYDAGYQLVNAGRFRLKAVPMPDDSIQCPGCFQRLRDCICRAISQEEA